MFPLQQNENEKRKIIQIASGKGGVGTSLIAANLASVLAENGKKTILIDLALGSSNLHTYLGLKNTNSGIGNFLVNRKLGFTDLIASTNNGDLRFVPGDALVTGLDPLTKAQIEKVNKSVLDLEADFIILDLGSGPNRHSLDFFGISNSGILVTRPFAPSITNTYAYLKNFIFRLLLDRFSSKDKLTKYLKNMIKEEKPSVLPAMPDILKDIENIDKESSKDIQELLSIIKPKIIVNFAEGPEDLDIYGELEELIEKNLGIKVECLGTIFNDDQIEETLAGMEPLFSQARESIAFQQIERIAQKILQSENFPELPLDLNYYSDALELAQIEARNDVLSIQRTEQVLAQEQSANGPSKEELMELISAQNKEIEGLRQTIRRITMNQE